MSGRIKAAFQVVLAYTKALPLLGVMIAYSTLHAISLDLLDYVWEFFFTVPGYKIKASERSHHLGTTEMFKIGARKTLADMRKKARLGEPAPDERLFDLKRNRWLNLLEVGGETEKPLAVLFGSCS